jgi:hypothetical protein
MAFVTEYDLLPVLHHPVPVSLADRSFLSFIAWFARQILWMVLMNCSPEQTTGASAAWHSGWVPQQHFLMSQRIVSMTFVILMTIPVFSGFTGWSGCSLTWASRRFIVALDIWRCPMIYFKETLAIQSSTATLRHSPGLSRKLRSLPWCIIN